MELQRWPADLSTEAYLVEKCGAPTRFVKIQSENLIDVILINMEDEGIIKVAYIVYIYLEKLSAWSCGRKA